MKSFDKLFGKKGQSEKTQQGNFDITNLEKNSEMINEDQFWTLIDNSLKNTSNQDEQEIYLVDVLQKLSPKEMIGFRLRTDKLLFDTYNSEMWCAGYIMNGGCSDDGFEYFRCWVISRGKETYQNAKANADYLINEVVDGEEFYDFESFWYVALTAFNNKTGKDLYDYIDYDKFTTHEGKYPQFEFKWEEDKPETMKAICPKLFKKFCN